MIYYGTLFFSALVHLFWDGKIDKPLHISEKNWKPFIKWLVVPYILKNWKTLRKCLAGSAFYLENFEKMAGR